MNNKRWTRHLVEKEKQEIRLEMASLAPNERIKILLKRLYNESESGNYLRSLLYGFYTLLTYLEIGGLTLRDVEKISEHCSAILRVQGISPGISRLSDLYWNLHSILGQIYRQAGLPWHAMVEQQLATIMQSSEKGFQEVGFPQLSMGICTFRLGNAEHAVKSFDQAISLGLGALLASRAKIERTRAIRLQGLAGEAEAYAKLLLEDRTILASYRREFEWEIICCEAIQENDLTPFFVATRNKRNHYEATYVIEAFFWSRVAKDTKWLDRFPKLGGRKKVKRLSMSDYPMEMRVARAIERLYQDAIPLSRRLETLPKILENVRKLRTVDKELLAWACISRWLAREKQFELAAAFISNYRSLSLQLSSGKKDDVLGLLRDLLDSSWYSLKRAA